MVADSEKSKADKDSVKAKRRGAFPRVPLKTVVELVDGIQQLGHGEPVRRRIAFEHIGRSPDSSVSYVLLSAANSGYALIKGGKNATHLKLTSSGEEIARSSSPSEKRAASFDILFANNYFVALIARFADKPLPLDSIATDFLEREHGLQHSDAEVCWDVVKQNLSDYGLLEESGGKQVIISREQASEAIDRKPNDLERHNQQKTEEAKHSEDKTYSSSKSAEHVRKGTRIIPQITFNVQVVIPENASPETYNAIFQSMSNHLLRQIDEE